MPAPWGPHPPDHDALVAERERRADEGEMPVVPKEECVVAGREAVVECEIVVRMTPATPRVAAAPMTVSASAPVAVAVLRAASAADVTMSLRSITYLPSGIQLRIDSRDTPQECAIAAEPELRRAFSGG